MSHFANSRCRVSEARWSQLAALDEELLKGGSLLSEWCSFIVRDADTAYANGAHIAAILTAVSGVETYLRSEYQKSGQARLVDLIDSSPISSDLRTDLHTLRKYRNRWVHVNAPWNDRTLMENPEELECELEKMAFFAVRTLRRILFENQWI